MNETTKESNMKSTKQHFICKSECNSASKSKLGVLIFACVILGGCASANNRYDQLNSHLSTDVDCKQAKLQIAALEESKISDSEKLANGIASVLPTSIVLNLIVGEYSNRAKIASGHYEEQRQNRINYIKHDCMLEEMPSEA